MTFHQILLILKARKLPLLIVFVLVNLAALLICLVLPKQYTATASVIVDVKSPDPINGLVMPAMMTQAYMTTQIDIIQSERVAQGVIKMLKLDQVGVLREQWQQDTEGEGSFESWLALVIQKKLKLKPSRESNVINIEYEAQDPRFASSVANAFVQAYIDVLLELRVDPARQYASLFDAQAKSFRDRLEAAQAKLSEYQRANGLLATDERLDVETARLNDLSTQLVILQGAVADSTSRRNQSGPNSPEVMQNAVIGALKADLARQEARLKELLSLYGSAHPQVIQLSASIAETKIKIETEIGRVAGSAGVNDSVNRSRETILRTAIEQQREKLLKLKAQRDESMVLFKEVESAQRTYDTMMARLSQTQLETQSNQTNVSVLKRASPPPFPSSPKYFLIGVLAVFVGGVLSLFVALLWELLNRRVRSKEDLTALADLVFIGEMNSMDRATSVESVNTTRLMRAKAQLGLKYSE